MAVMLFSTLGGVYFAGSWMKDIIAQKPSQDLIERCEYAESSLEALADEMIYNGNSVSWLYKKHQSDIAVIHDIWGVLRAAGIPPDGELHIITAIQLLAHQAQELKNDR